jgi:hypothetical protein
MRKYPPADFGYVPPNADFLITVTEDMQNVTMKRYDIGGEKASCVYSQKSHDTMNAMVMGFQHARYSGETTVNIISPSIRPVYISPQGILKSIKVSDQVAWRLLCGVAIWKPGALALVENAGEGKQDRIIEQRMN